MEVELVAGFGEPNGIGKILDILENVKLLSFFDVVSEQCWRHVEKRKGWLHYDFQARFGIEAVRLEADLFALDVPGPVACGVQDEHLVRVLETFSIVAAKLDKGFFLIIFVEVESNDLMVNVALLPQLV